MAITLIVMLLLYKVEMATVHILSTPRKFNSKHTTTLLIVHGQLSQVHHVIVCRFGLPLLVREMHLCALDK